jgi:DNA (cytosine-5)-methyltransferase 1
VKAARAFKIAAQAAILFYQSTEINPTLGNGSISSMVMYIQMVQGQKVSIFSFFSGVGFLDLGFEAEGCDIAFVNEYIPEFARAHKYARQQMGIELPKYGYHIGSAEDFLSGESKDFLTNIVATEKITDNLVGFIAGPPCPDFSIAGKHRGGEGEKGRLSATYIEMVCEQRPDFFLFENVRGLWSTAKHRAFYDQLLAKVHEAGYTTHHRLINALEYGAPQDRNRVILIGLKNDTLSMRGEFPWGKYAKFDRANLLKLDWPTTDEYRECAIRYAPTNIPLELTAEYWFRKNDVYNHPNGEHYFKPQSALPRFQSIQEGNSKGKSFKRLHRWRYSPTCAYGNNEVHVHPYLPRRLSVAEALSLQSLPKEFVLPPDMTLSAMFKVIGNGVPFVAAQAIARTLIDYSCPVHVHSGHSMPLPSLALAR